MDIVFQGEKKHPYDCFIYFIPFRCNRLGVDGYHFFHTRKLSTVPDCFSRSIIWQRNFFAAIGLLIGAIFGYGINKIETMALFGAIGLTLGSYWMSIFSNPYAYITDANDILIYSCMAATMGAFMAAGIFYPEMRMIYRLLFSQWRMLWNSLAMLFFRNDGKSFLYHHH